MRQLKGPRFYGDTELSPDCYAFVLVQLHAGSHQGHGMPVTVRGNVGDKQLAIRALEIALDAVRSSSDVDNDRQLIIPGKDAPVPQHEAFPTLERGDMT